MCNIVMALPTAGTAEQASTSGAPVSSNKLFRPWAASTAGAAKLEVEAVTSSSSMQRKRNKMYSLRRDATKTTNTTTNHVNTTSQSSSNPGGVIESMTCPRVDDLPMSNHVDLATATADAFYAELSRADLARLGLVCPADIARLRARKQRPKKYHCPHCNVAFSNNGQLRGHIRIHTGERPFACQHAGCGKAFTRNEELTRHRRIHSGVRPFPCVACGKRFGRKDHLKKHTRTHQKLHPMPHHSTSATSAAAAVHAAAAAAFNAAATASLFPLDPTSLLPSLVPYSYSGVFGF